MTLGRTNAGGEGGGGNTIELFVKNNDTYGATTKVGLETSASPYVNAIATVYGRFPNTSFVSVGTITPSISDRLAVNVDSGISESATYTKCTVTASDGSAEGTVGLVTTKTVGVKKTFIYTIPLGTVSLKIYTGSSQPTVG